MKNLFLTIILNISLFYIASCQENILDKRISVRYKKVKIKTVIKNLSQKHKINFSYKSDMPDLQKRISLNLHEVKLNKLLSAVFRNTNIRFLYYSNQIILVEAKMVSRKIFLEGTIFDAETKLPIPYATVMFKKTGEGVIADYKGNFEIETDDAFLADTLRFSAFSYTFIEKALGSVYKQDKIKLYLRKRVFPINEVSINAKDYKTIKIGNKGIISRGSLYMDTNGQQTALFIENELNREVDVIQISYKLSSKGNADAPFRVRLYSIDKQTGKPGKSILQDIVVVKPPDKKGGWFDIDISTYHVKAPAEGFFVAMEGVFPNDFNFYFGDDDFTELRMSENDTKNISLPELSYGQRLMYNKKGKNNTWHYSLSHKWFQVNKKHFNVMIKAKLQYKIDNSQTKNN